MLKKEEKKQLDAILKAHEYNATAVIAIMQDIQKIYHYLPEEMLSYIAKELGLSVVVSGNKWAKEAITALGAERYIVYTEENYEEVLPLSIMS